MTTYTAHFESQSSGTSVTTSNSSTYGDSAVQAVQAINTVVAYVNGTSAHGGGAVSMSVNSGASTSLAALQYGSVNSTAATTRCYLNLGSLPNSTSRIIAIRNASQASNVTGDMGGVNLNPNGTIVPTDINGNGLATSSSSTQALQTGTWYRFENQWNISTSSGFYKTAVYVGDSTSPFYSYTSATNLNTGTTNIAAAVFGKSSTGGVFTGNWYIDDIGFVDNNTAFLGPYSPGGPAISTSVSGTYALLDATGSTSVNGGALSYSISPSTGSFQLSTGKFIVPMTTTASSVSLTVSEAGGGSTSRSVAIPALVTAASSQTTVMIQRYVAGAWQ